MNPPPPPVESVEPPGPPGTRPGTLGFIGALRGMWLLVWARQMTKKRLLSISGGIVAMLFLMGLSIDHQSDSYGWIIGFYLTFLIPFSCLNLCGSMIRDEVQANTLCFLCTRPLRRFEIFLLKYFCHIFWLQMVFLIITPMMFGVAIAKGYSDIISVMMMLLVVQFMAIMAWGALSAFLGMLHQRYVVIGIVYWFVIELGIGSVQTGNINQLSLLRHVQSLLGQDLAARDAMNWLPPDPAWSAALILMIAPVIFLALGSLMFTVREYLPSNEVSQK